MKQTKKNTPVFKLALILLVAVQLTGYFTAGLYAKYAANSSAEGSAQVALFAIETDLDRVKLGTDTPPMLQLGGVEEVASVTLPFYLESGSEVTVGYDVSVTFQSAVPEYLIFSLTDGTESRSVMADGEKQEFVFSAFGTLAQGAPEVQRANLNLIITADPTLITDEITLSGALLTVRVYQMD